MGTTVAPSLRDRWTQLREAEPALRIREQAERLETSEATLLSFLLGQGVRRLRCEPGAMLKKLQSVGPVMALTRNDGAVHERHGVYGPLEVHGNVGLINTADIDLRLDFSSWALGFAEVKKTGHRVLRSLQFFDSWGTAIHKVYLTGDDSLGPWEALIEEFLDADQTTVFDTPPRPDRVAPQEPTEAAREALVEAWTVLKDPHHFHGLVKRQGFHRGHALAAAEGKFTRKVPEGTLERVLRLASDKQVPLMVFVGNRGCVQIHTGPVSQVQPLGSWINVLDPHFNLHVDLATVAQSWVVEKPSPDGTVTSLELLTPSGDLVVQVFGERKPGIPEQESWKALVGSV